MTQKMTQKMTTNREAEKSRYASFFFFTCGKKKDPECEQKKHEI